MRYMFLVYSREKDFAEASPQALQRVKDGHWAVMDKTRQRGIFLAGEPLQSTATATTIRKEDEKRIVLVTGLSLRPRSSSRGTTMTDQHPRSDAPS